MKKQNGITLVALVITIIVLLILAGVSISLVVGNNGVLNQASSAVIANKEAQAKEEVAMAWSSAITKYWSDWANNATVNKNDYLSKSVLDPYLENGSLVEDPTLSDGVYTVKYQTGGAVYTFTVDSTGNILLTGSAEAGVTPSSLVAASQVALVPTTYYGKTVNYSANGVSDWRVFYSNGTNIFLISSNFAEATNIPAGAGMTTESTYRTYWASAPATIDTSNRHDDLFMATNYIINNSTGNNSKCVSRLLDTGLWSGYVNPTYADYAIGGPTIEMWIASWNAKYPGDKLKFAPNSPSSSSLGYGIAEETGSINAQISAEVMSSKTGYNDELYYPITESTLTIDIFNHYSQSTNYWIASPGYVNDQAVFAVAANGLIYSSTFQNDHVSIRPVVALKAGTVLTSGTDGFDYNLGTN